MSKRPGVGIWLLTIASLFFSASPGRSAEITNFTGADPGEGLDLDGEFVYAVNMRGPGGFVVRGIEFTEDIDTEGFILDATHEVLAWATPDYGDSDDDNELEFIMESIRWSQAPAVVNIEMDVEPNQAYKLQMLFTESCCDRSFDIVFEDELLVDDFTIYEHHLDDFFNLPSREDGVLITHEFTSTDNVISLQLGTGAFGFPDNNGHISALTLELLSEAPMTGDFNGNGTLDVPDIDDLTSQSAAGTNAAAYDLTGDGLVNVDDVNEWVTVLFNSWIGDANLDGQFNSGDLVAVLASGAYEAGTPSVWSSGDFDGDGVTNSSDLVAALAGGGYEVGPRAATAAVPEPSTLLVLAPGLLVVAGFLRRRDDRSGRRPAG